MLAVQRSKDTAISLLDSRGTHVYRYPALKYTPVSRDRLKRQPIIQQALEGKEAAAEALGPRDEIRLAAFVPIPSIGWVAASSRAKDEVMAGITRTLLPYALFMLLVTLAAFGVAVTLSRPISVSIRRLQDHAAELGQGEVKRLEEIPGPREIKNLSEAFNDMAEKIRSREKALRESEERFRLFMNNSPTISWVKDEQGRYVYLSKTYEDRFGVRFEDWRGKTDAELWPDQATAEQFRKHDLAVLAADHPIQIIEETVNADGSRSFWLNCKFPFRDAAGNRFVAGIGLDVTEQKRVEEALRQGAAGVRIHRHP